MAKDKDRLAQDHSSAGEGGMSEEEIDETLLETFPASDPPSWTLGTDHKQEPQSEPEAKESTAGGTEQKK